MADASACAEPHDPTDWEEWDPNTGSLAQHMVAGSAAGLLEHTCMYPVDTIKTHSQCARCGVSQSAVAVARDMVRAQGFGRMWRGVGTMFSGCVPAHAAYFSIFETIKRRTGADQAGHRPLAAAAARGHAGVGGCRKEGCGHPDLEAGSIQFSGASAVNSDPGRAYAG